MRIKGVGIVKKEVAMSILSREGKAAVKSGEISLEELGRLYKISLVKKCSAIGTCTVTFRENYGRIPNSLKDELTPDQLGKLVDCFYLCYNDEQKGI